MKTFQLFRQLALVAAVSMSTGAAWAELPEATMYKDPNCGCCSKWAEHMREAGFTVKEMPSREMARIKAQLGVPEALGSCHTAQVGKYVIEGHVPAADVKRLLAVNRPVHAACPRPACPWARRAWRAASRTAMMWCSSMAMVVKRCLPVIEHD